MSKFISILGLVVIAANAAYANLEPGTDSRITLGLYFVGIAGAAIGKGWERLKALQSTPAIIAGLLAAVITAVVSVDPAMLTFLPANVKSLLVIIAGLIVTIGKSVVGWNEPEPPDWRNKSSLRCIAYLALAFTLTQTSACGPNATTSTARKFINVLDSSAHNTGIALRVLPTLVDAKTITPEVGIAINEGLGKYNAALLAAHTFLTGKLVFDSNGKATLTLNPNEQATAIVLLDNLSDAANVLLDENRLSGNFKYTSELRALLPLLRDVVKIAANLKRAFGSTASQQSIEIHFGNEAQYFNAWAY